MLSDFTKTNTGLSNVPDSMSIKNIKIAINEFFQPLQDYINSQIVINSGFRSQQVNKAVGGVTNSAHLVGKGFDFFAVGRSPRWLYEKIKELGLNKKIDYIDFHVGYLHIELL